MGVVVADATLTLIIQVLHEWELSLKDAQASMDQNEREV